jgi:hypothetical protein
MVLTALAPEVALRLREQPVRSCPMVTFQQAGLALLVVAAVAVEHTPVAVVALLVY